MPRQKSKQGFYRPGDYYIMCQMSGFKIRASDARKMWDGRMVHKDFWELRHPQDFVRGVKDRIAPPEPRAEPGNDFLSTNAVSEDDL